MTRDQKAVAMGASSGIAAMVLLVWTLSHVIVAPVSTDSASERIAYALPWTVVAILPFVAMVIAVGNARFKSEAIDPTLGKESQAMIVDGRVADNTLQQFILFLVGSLGLAVTLPLDRLSIVAAAAITFLLMRIAFWIDYRIRPVYRAFGFSSTIYLNLGMLAATLWLWLR